MHAAIRSYLARTHDLVAQIDVDDLARCIEGLFQVWQRGGTVHLCGNGGSASTAQHFAADLAMLGDEARPFRARSLNDNPALISALTNDAGWERIYLDQLAKVWRSGDLLLLVSVHGGVGADRAGPWSQNLVDAARWVREQDGASLALLGCDGGVLRGLCAESVIVPDPTTDHVEGLHGVLQHLVVAMLREKIQAQDPSEKASR